MLFSAVVETQIRNVASLHISFRASLHSLHMLRRPSRGLVHAASVETLRMAPYMDPVCFLRPVRGRRVRIQRGVCEEDPNEDVLPVGVSDRGDYGIVQHQFEISQLPHPGHLQELQAHSSHDWRHLHAEKDV